MRMASAVVKGRGSSPYKDIEFQLLKNTAWAKQNKPAQESSPGDASVQPLLCCVLSLSPPCHCAACSQASSRSPCPCSGLA